MPRDSIQTFISPEVPTCPSVSSVLRACPPLTAWTMALQSLSDPAPHHLRPGACLQHAFAILHSLAGTLQLQDSHLEGVARFLPFVNHPERWSIPDTQAGTQEHTHSHVHTCNHAQTLADMQSHMSPGMHAYIDMYSYTHTLALAHMHVRTLRVYAHLHMYWHTCTHAV